MAEYIKELKIRYVKTGKKNPFYGKLIRTSDELYKIFKDIQFNDKEQLISVHFNNRLEINCYETLSIGNTESCMASPKDIFKGVLLSNSSAFALIHNHPTGDPKPSSADLEVHKIVEKGAKYIGIMFLDFMIVGDTGYWSIKQNCWEKYGE